MTDKFDRFLIADLNERLPDPGDQKFDFIISLDVIEHLRSPEEFLDQLGELANKTGAEVIITTANIGFIIMRLSLLLGRFEYGKRGILDLTHTRLFTFATLRRAMTSAGFVITREEGISVPAPFLIGSSALAKILMKISQLLIRLRPALFGFQMLFVAKPRPSLATLLESAESVAEQKFRAIKLARSGRHSFRKTSAGTMKDMLSAYLSVRNDPGLG